MNDAVWVVVAAAIGAGASLLATWLAQRYAAAQAREIRQHDREEASRERQRRALIEYQDALATASMAILGLKASSAHDSLSEMKTEERVEAMRVVWLQAEESVSTALTFAYRVESDQIRSMIPALRSAADGCLGHVLGCPKPEAIDAFRGVATQIENLIGEALRSVG